MQAEIKTQDILKRLPPQNLDAERAVIGAILVDSTAMNKVVEILSPDTFYSPANQIIFKCFLTLYNQSKPIDILTVGEYLSANSELTKVGGREYLSELAMDNTLASNIVYYAKIIKDNSTKRRLISAGSTIVENSYSLPDTQVALENAEKLIYDISQERTTNDLLPISDLLMKTVDQIEYRFNNQGAYTGVISGYYDLDKLTTGFQKSDLIILAARPSMGKTALALNIAQNAAIRGGVPTAIFSLEMSKEQLVQRIICAEAELDAQKVRTGQLETKEWEKITNAMNILHAAPIMIDDTGGVTVSEIRSKLRRLKMKCPNLGLVIIDYLQLINEKSSPDRNQQISTISRSLKSIARELELPLIALSQLSRKVEDRQDKTPMLSDLRESGAIEQDADIVMFVYREGYYERDNPELKDKASIVVAKQRNGPTGKVDLLFQGSTTKFKNKIKHEPD